MSSEPCRIMPPHRCAGSLTERAVGNPFHTGLSEGCSVWRSQPADDSQVLSARVEVVGGE